MNAKLKSFFHTIIFSILSLIIFYLFVDLLYTDLPPYAIELNRVKTYIYFNKNRENQVEIYSFLEYKEKFLFKLPLKPQGIFLSFPLLNSNIENVIQFKYGGFENLILETKDNYPSEIRAYINYNDFHNNCFMYIKGKLKEKNLYIHYFDLPYFWSSSALIEHDLIVSTKENLIVMNILPYKIEERKDYKLISVKNIKKDRLFIRFGSD
ncbi:MAG: hypothetical protein RMJ36_00665 [Candidatus Calescibacterium sp.]|nr:hypothetical protein [Candidatus Calescibacterium sp.]MDW8132156.1 hypothetical protein [Candidatus Calescibacterium sp.]